MSSPGDDIGRRISRRLINSYFTTQQYPYTRHHIDSYDQFMGRDLQSIIRSSNPILIVKDLIKGTTNSYAYKVELFVGGPDASAIKIGTPIVSLNNTEDVRVLFPNEARLRNLTYAADVSGDVLVRITYTDRRPDGQLEERVQELTVPDVRLFRMPIMLHSRFCLLNGKPKEFLQQAGECPYDHGGYFVVDGAEKVLVSRQEKAFNTFYIAQTPRDPKVHTYATLSSLSPETRAVKYFAMAMMRETPTKQPVINVSLPFIRKPINVFILFRLMGVQADEDIVRLIFPDADGAENRFLADKLIPTIVDAHPILNHYTALQFVKTFTKGFSEVHIIDIIRNQLFVHIPDLPGARVNYLAECVRSLLRVAYDFDKQTDRDDIRNQRCLTSGFLIQMLFNGIYAKWRKAVALTIDKEYNYNAQIYAGESFANIFDVGNKARIFNEGYMSEAITRAFKGKWGAGLGEEKAGVLQSLSRLSYLDFMSHCRRVVLEFDTSVKLTSPRHLHPSQFGYFCTHETPGGASIGITKNLSILTYISTGMQTQGLIDWLRRRGGVASTINAEMKKTYVPVTVNNGIVGYTATPLPLLQLLKAFKHTGYLPATTGLGFSYADRRLFIMTDEGRPMRPLVILRKAADGRPDLPVKRIAELGRWRDLIMGTHPGRVQVPLNSSEFTDPLAEMPKPTFEDYMANLTPHLCVIEYVDPYEHNEAYIACFPEQINAETTHMEIHPSTVGSLLTTLIPYANHNQAPRNQLSCSQSKQGVSIYATNWQNRFDNSGHILCYGEAPLSRTMYYDYMAEGKIGYGTNVILALAMYDGYNQEDGVVINKDALERGLFRSVAYRSYEFYEEDDEKTGAKTRIGNPARISGWTDLKPGRDYTKLDDRGIVRVGTYVDEDTVICGGYLQPDRASYKDASITAQVWTSGIVENVSVMVNNKGLRLVKIRVVGDRSPELGDKFSNRHGQKGTIGMMFPGRDLPRTADGVVPDIIVNPHCIPSRMTIAQVLEQLLAKLGAVHGAIGDATTFMNEGSTADAIGDILENEYGFERAGNEILYDGKSGVQIPTAIFVAPVYHMRLKHMVEDKWQARTQGRREQRTHQPTGGRGKEGGLRIGEMDRDAIITHGVSAFLRESIMKRSDGETFPICTGCGTLPIYNERLGIAVCPMCQGPLRFAGDTADTLELIPPLTKPTAPIVKVEMPFTLKLLDQELNTFMNGGFRFLTSGGGTAHINVPLPAGDDDVQASVQLMERILPESDIPDFTAAPEADSKEETEANAGSLANLASLAKKAGLALVPLETAIQRNAAEVAAAAAAAAAQPQAVLAPPEDDLSGLDIQGQQQQQQQTILPGAAPPPQVLGGKAPTVPVLMQQQQQPQSLMVGGPQQLSSSQLSSSQLYPAAMPVMTPQQIMTAATGPLVVVDTSPQAMREVIEDVGVGGVNSTAAAAAPIPTIRRAVRPKQVSFGAAESAAPPPPPTATITVNKLG